MSPLRRVEDGDVDAIRVGEECSRDWVHILDRPITTFVCGRLIALADDAAARLCPERGFTFTVDVNKHTRSVMLTCWEPQK